jgi:ABC-type nickel/cobalt efflux system permease component RcnA
MWDGDYVVWLFAFANCLLLAMNIWWMWRQLKRAKETLRMRMEAHVMLSEVINEVTSMRADEYKVCKSCGKIVQGICERCLMQPRAV